MKQSSVLLHSKVKKSPLQRFIDYSFRSHSSVVHNLDTDQRSKVYHSAFTVHFTVGVLSEQRQVWSTLTDVCIVFFFFFEPRENRRKMV